MGEPASSSDKPAEQMKKEGLYKIHMRLGDVLSETQNWADSMTEYARALDLARGIHGDGSENLIQPLFQLLASRANNKSLAKAQTENEKLIQECRKLVQEQIARGELSEEKKERRELLLEELNSYENQCGVPPSESSQEAEAPNPEAAQHTILYYQLGTLQPHEEEVVDLEGRPMKRRRVDLSHIYQQAPQQ